MPEPTIAAGFVRGLMEFAVSKGATRTALERRSGLVARELADPDARIPLARYMALVRAGKELSGDPALALHFAETSDISHLSIMGLVAPSAATLTEAFALLNRYTRLGVDVESTAPERFQLAPGDDGVWIIDTRANPNEFFELTEGTFVRFVSNIGLLLRSRGLALDAPVAKLVHVTHADPGYRAEYERIFRAPVIFDSDKNALLLSETVLDLRTPEAPEYGVRVMSQRADALLESLADRTTRGRVEHLLTPLLATRNIRMDAIAEKLGCTRSTLLRQLKAEGVTFEQVVDELRHKMALHLLTAEKASVKEAAHLVGFSEPAAFSRAFKRWTGMTPRAARSSASRRKLGDG
jgi:AraC-like DNA-binding protein